MGFMLEFFPRHPGVEELAEKVFKSWTEQPAFHATNLLACNAEEKLASLLCILAAVVLIHEAGIDHYFQTGCPSVRMSFRPTVQNFEIERKSLPARTVGWPSGSLMTPVLFNLFF